LGKQGFKFRDEGDFEIWVKELSKEEIAVCFLNRSEKEITKNVDLISVIERFGFETKWYKAIDIWETKKVKKKKLPKKVTIESHGVVVLKLAKE
jgi:alpha-galactosidase